MSALVTSKITPKNATECVLSPFDSYINLLNIQAINSRNVLLKERSVRKRCWHYWAFTLQGALNAKC
jgi:hypothetical protein